jgi:hypothetical protein
MFSLELSVNMIEIGIARIATINKTSGQRRTLPAILILLAINKIA